MLTRTCEQCKNQFQAMTNLRRFCAICINERKNRKQRETYHKQKNNEPVATIGGIRPCKWCKQPLRITNPNKRVHKKCLKEYNRMMRVRRYERNRIEGSNRPSKRKYTKPIHAWITPEMLKDLQRLCKRSDTHIANMIRRLIKTEVRRQQWSKESVNNATINSKQ